MSSDKSFNDVHSSTVHEDTMCMVMPLRLGIFLVAVFTVLWCATLLIFPSFAQSMVIWTGGYCLKTRVALGIAEFTGIVFGICGIIGVWYCKRSYVMTFNCWQVFRILVFGFVYYVDHDRQASSWENPLVPYLRRLVEIGRAYLKTRTEEFF